MKSEKLLTAFTDINGAYIDSAREALGYGGESGGKRKINGKKVFGVFLVAAVVAALLTVTAYAKGWFGLGGLKTGESAYGDILSVQGLADSLEAKGASEWLEYRNANPAGETDEETAKKDIETLGSYGVSSQADLDKLNEICEKYSLAYRGKFSVPEGEQAYYESAKIGRLTKEFGGSYNVFWSGYVYACGTFQFEGSVYSDTRDYGISYQLRCTKKGTLDDVIINVEDVNAFTEWDYTTSDGTALHLANSESDSYYGRASLALLETDDAFIVLTFSHDAETQGLNGAPGKSVSFNISDAELESLVECFDWLALSGTGRGMGEDFVSYEPPAADSAANVSGDVDWDSLKSGNGYALKLCYEQQIAPYIDDFQLIDCSVIEDSFSCYGWLEFSGEPKEKLDWAYTRSIDGKKIYCRSVNAYTSYGNEDTWSLQPAFDMRSCPFLSEYENIGTEEEPDYIYLGHELNELSSASLYLQQTGKTYTVSDSEALETLSAMLKYTEVSGGSGAEIMSPLYLDFADGTSAVLYVADSGANRVRMYDGPHVYSLGMTVFEIFDIPLEAEGYSENNGVVTTRFEPYDEAFDGAVEIDYEKDGLCTECRIEDPRLGGFRRVRYEYDEGGRLARSVTYDLDDSVSAVASYTYDEGGRLIEKLDEVESRNMWTKTEYSYDGQGRLTEKRGSDSEAPDSYTVYTYTYDDDGNCREISPFAW